MKCSEVRCPRSCLREEIKEIAQDLVRLFHFKLKIVRFVKFDKFANFANFVIFTIAWELLVLLAFFNWGLKRSNPNQFQTFLVLDSLEFCQELKGCEVLVGFFHFNNFNNSYSKPSKKMLQSRLK